MLYVSRCYLCWANLRTYFMHVATTTATTAASATTTKKINNHRLPGCRGGGAVRNGGATFFPTRRTRATQPRLSPAGNVGWDVSHSCNRFVLCWSVNSVQLERILIKCHGSNRSQNDNLLARPTPMAAMVLILGTSFDTTGHQRVHMDVG